MRVGGALTWQVDVLQVVPSKEELTIYSKVQCLDKVMFLLIPSPTTTPLSSVPQFCWALFLQGQPPGHSLLMTKC